ncbi:uncharacterized protein [Ranitomeya imitator]|uniref:uncharacterized protein n=1 Tax=Ranitomeya imitator TaxID=111125 RepID=UPI0037E8ABCB
MGGVQGTSASSQDSGTAGKETEAPQGGIPPLSRNVGEAIANADRSKDTAAVAQQNMGSPHIILAPGQHSAYSQASIRGVSQFPSYPLIFSTPYSQIPGGQMTPSQAAVVEHQNTPASLSLMATGVRAPIQGAGTPALDNRQSAGIRPARRSSSSSSSSPREHRRSGHRKRDCYVSKRRSYRSRSSRRSRRSRASRWRSPSSSGSSSGRSHRQESSHRRSIHRTERQGPMTPVAREASCPDAGAPIGFTGTAPSGALGGGGLPTFDLGCPGDLMPLIRSSIAPSTWKAYDGVRPSVWIVGHSYIYWAARRAELCPGERSLGFDDIDVIWRGMRGMMWSQVLPEVVHIARVASSPTIVVIHAGGNDLASSPLAELLTLIRSDMDKFPSFFPLMRLVWSEVIPRLVWRGARELNAMERSRRTLNQRISRFIRFKNGVVVRHHRLEGDNSGFLLPDGVHLNEVGLDIFLNGIREGVVQAMHSFGGS